uniref:Retrovirus-related Pol polyprotein from transposon TNT 1-94 n=1 Tax=Rhizophora mucronata TaxID=61149 RepID=A0A2P2NGP1_RHIMU
MNHVVGVNPKHVHEYLCKDFQMSLKESNELIPHLSLYLLTILNDLCGIKGIQGNLNKPFHRYSLFVSLVKLIIQICHIH